MAAPARRRAPSSTALPADVVTLALEGDINKIADAGLLAKDWRGPSSRTIPRPTPRRSSSSSARAIRRAFKDWGDLVKEGVEVITPNPKTSGGARWNYLAAWAYAERADSAATRRRSSSSSAGALQARAGARFRRPRLDHDVRGARHRRRAARLGERGVPRHQRARTGRVRDRRAADLDHGGAAGRAGRCECRSQGHPRGRSGISRLPLQRRGAEHHRQELLPPLQARGR